MKYREIGKTGIHASVLGLGCMRFPMQENEPTKIDEDRAIEMIRYAIDHGVNYIDTAYPYHDGESEVLVGKALTSGYRERITLITKSPSWLMKTQEDFFTYLDEQLSKLQTECIDIYLLHALDKERWATYQNIGIFDAIEQAKKDGKIKHVGFSFHDEYPVFTEIVDAYDWDVCMLQLNYMDMEEQAGLKGLEYAKSKGLPVIVMEPLKGGMLANPSEDILNLWQTYPEQRTPVEWALRYMANFENVKVVLSGMSSLEQLKMNIEIADQLEVGNLDEAALDLISEVKEKYKSKIQVPCTQCKYCVPCPQGVEIPRIFTMYNRAYTFDTHALVQGHYQTLLTKEAKASNCVSCGICETKCPQKISIMDMLAKISTEFETV